MAHTRLFQPALDSLMAIPFLPKQVAPDLLYNPDLLLVSPEVLDSILTTYQYERFGLYSADEVTDKVRQLGGIFFPETIPYGVFVRQELVDDQQEVALYLVCSDEQRLGEGAFGKVLPVQRINGIKKGQWFALKVVSIESNQQLLDAGLEEQTIIDLGFATPSTPRSSISDCAEEFETPEQLEIKPRIVRKSHSSRILPISSLADEREATMQRSGSAKAISPINVSSGGGRRSSLTLASSPSASSPVIPIYFSSPSLSPARHHTPLLNFKLKKSTETACTPPSRSGSPFSFAFSIDDLPSTPDEEIKYEYDIFMDLIKGESLKTIFENEDNIPFSSMLRLQMAIDIAQALEDLIKSNRLHCDIKPQNIMYDRCMLKASFIDFGETKLINTASMKCESDRYNGTSLYMAPELREQARLAEQGRVARFIASEKTEVYALGVLLADIFPELRSTIKFNSIYDDESYVVNEYPILEEDPETILSHHVLKVIRDAIASKPEQRISVEELKTRLIACRQYVNALDQQILVGVFDVGLYFSASQDKQAKLFDQAVHQCAEYFQEIWFVHTSGNMLDSLEYIKLKRKFEQANMVVGDVVVLGKDMEQAQYNMYKHLNMMAGSRKAKGVGSIVTVLDSVNTLDLTP